MTGCQAGPALAAHCPIPEPHLIPRLLLTGPAWRRALVLSVALLFGLYAIWQILATKALPGAYTRTILPQFVKLVNKPLDIGVPIWYSVASEVTAMTRRTRRGRKIVEIEARLGKPLRQIVIDALNQHETYEAAAESLGVPRGTFEYWAYRLNIQTRKIAYAP